MPRRKRCAIKPLITWRMMLQREKSSAGRVGTRAEDETYAEKMRRMIDSAGLPCLTTFWFLSCARSPATTHSARGWRVPVEYPRRRSDGACMMIAAAHPMARHVVTIRLTKEASSRQAGAAPVLHRTAVATEHAIARGKVRRSTPSDDLSARAVRKILGAGGANDSVTALLSSPGCKVVFIAR